METEGSFRLVSVVGRSAGKPNRWQSAGYVHAGDELKALETVAAGDEFETHKEAVEAAISAARHIAIGLSSDDSWAKRDTITQAETTQA